MQINAPATITPVVNINQPTEALRTDVRRLQRIPESNQPSDSARLKQSGRDQDTSQRIPEGAREQNSREDLNDDSESLSDNSPSRQQAEAQEQRAEAQEQREIRELRSTDRKVRAHEAAHASVGGVHAGSPSFTFVTGPDGVRYAVAGEVPIDVSEVPGDPAATLDKMRQVRRAALAPADPSIQDRRVAAEATAKAAEATAELAAERAEEASSGGLLGGESSSGVGRESSANVSSSGVDSQQSSLNAAAQSRFLRRLQFSGAVASPPAGANINTQA